MLPGISDANVDRIAAVGSYYVASAAFLLTIAALLVTAVGLYFAVRQTSLLKQLEVEQKRFENALDLFRIISGVKDTYPAGGAATFLQLAAIQALSNFPEYKDVMEVMRNWYATAPEVLERESFVKAFDRTIRIVSSSAKSSSKV